jgi:purine-binding chemotaxis protein CheW
MNHHGTSLPTPTATEILRVRAQKLARPADVAPATETLIEVLEFRLAQERYAVETGLVREVHPLRDLTPLPCTPSFVLGIVNVRGRILPVFDLKKFFDLPPHGLTDLHRIIIVRQHDLEFGLLADVIVGVHSIAMESLQTTLPTLTGIRADYLKGVTSDALTVLDLGRLMADPKINVHEEVEI